MVDSNYSAITNIEQVQSQKEVTANEGFDRISAMVAATVSVAVTSGDFTPTSANPTPQWQANVRFVLTGTPGVPRLFIAPSGAAFCKFFIVQNDSDDQVTVQVGAGPAGTTVVIPTLEQRILYSDGTNIVAVATAGGVTVEDDGTLIVSNADTLNFTGPGVEVSDVGGEATINIPGGGSSQPISINTRFRGCYLGPKSGTQGALAAATFNAITFDAEVYDTDSFHDNVTNNSRITMPAGFQRVRLTGGIGITGATTVDLRIRKNGTTLSPDSVNQNDVRGQVDTGVIDVDPTGGDFFELVEFHASGTGVVQVAGTWLACEVVEEVGAGSQPSAFISVPQPFKGVLLNRTANFVSAGNVTDVIVWENVVFEESFQPPDQGGLQRFWLGADRTFTTVDQGAETATVTAHGLVTGEGPFRLTTAGTLPTGLAIATNYWAINVGTNTLAFATSRANALSDTRVNISSAGTGTHTIDTAQHIVIPAGVSKVQLNGSADEFSDLLGRLVLLFQKEGSAAFTGNITAISENAAGELIDGSSAIIEVTEGDRFEMGVFGADAYTLAGGDFTWFQLQVIEVTDPPRFPGVTVDTPHRGVRVERTANLSIVNNTFTQIPWQQASFDTGLNGVSFAEFVTNPSRITVPAGATKVRLTANGYIDNDVSVNARFLKNGALTFDGNATSDYDQGVAALFTGFNIASGVLDVVATDFFELDVRQIDPGAGANNLLADGGNRTWFELEVVETDDSAFVPEQIETKLIADGVALAINSIEYKKVAVRRFSLNDDFAGSVAHAGTAPTVTTQVFDVKRNGTTIGTITFAVAAQTATFATTGAVQEDFEVGDRLTIETQGTVNAAIRDVAINMHAFRT